MIANMAFPTPVVWTGIALGAIVAIRRQDRNVLLLLLTMAVVPPAMVLQRVLPPARTLTYLLPFAYGVAAYGGVATYDAIRARLGVWQPSIGRVCGVAVGTVAGVAAVLSIGDLHRRLTKSHEDSTQLGAALDAAIRAATTDDVILCES